MALSEQVTVLQDGTYLGPNLKAFEAKAGAVIDVLGGWYPDALVSVGLAARVTEFEEPAAQVTEPAKPRKTRSRA